jgi:hypothetical protein
MSDVFVAVKGLISRSGMSYLECGAQGRVY